MFRFAICRAFSIGYRRGYRRARAELRHQLEDTNRQTRDAIDQLRKSNARACEYLAATRAVRREITELRARYGGADAEHDEPTRLH
jgi:hypothetical protein